jgi:hypothetical protein
MFRRAVKLTNGKVRVLVGLLLAAAFCVQCTRSEAVGGSKLTMLGAKAAAGGEQAAGLEDLARTDHIKLLRQCMANYDRCYRDYTCTLTKQERLAGQLGKEQTVQVKFMENPFSVAMAWVKNKPTAEKVIYVEGKYDNQMLVKPNLPFAGMIGTVTRPPDGPDAKRQSLRTVNQFGFKRSLRSLLDVYEEAAHRGELKQEFGGRAEFDGRACLLLVRYLPERDEYPGYKTVTCIDEQYLVPTFLEAFDSSGQLLARYSYQNVKFNTGLTADDFLPEANGMAPLK